MSRKVLLTVLFLSAAFLPACATREALSRIGLEVRQVKVKNFSPDGFSAVVYMKVDNPNWFGVAIKELRYTVYLNGNEVGKGNLEKEVDVPRNGSVVAELPLDVGLHGLDGLINEALRGEMVYRVKGEAVFGTMLGSYTYQFDKEKAAGRR